MFFLILILLSINVQANDNKEDTNNWDEWQKEDYWEWHTRETTKDMAYNGKHIQIQDNAIDFYGYGVTSYKDFLYKECHIRQDYPNNDFRRGICSDCFLAEQKEKWEKEKGRNL